MKSKLFEEKSIRHEFFLPEQKMTEPFVRVHQVHGNLVFDAASVSESTQADGIILRACDQRLGPVAVQTADCIPALFWSEDSVVAAIHAGWRGVENQILVKAVEMLLQKFKLNQSEILVALGPSIGACCFEVDEKTAGLFSPWQHCIERKSQPQALGDKSKQAPATDNGIWIDLKRIACEQLTSQGILPQNIDSLNVCTYCSPLGFASYRRATHARLRGEAESTAKRQWSFIG